MSLVIDAVQATLGASEPWPDDVALYQQYQVEQITVPDSAQCLAVETFLHMCGLKFRLEQRTNAEEMSPSGQVPFIQVGRYLVSEFDPIVAFVNTKGFSLSTDLPETERSEMRAYMSMIESILGNAELYMAWLHGDTANEVTKPRYGFSHPWPLRWILPWRKQREIKAKLQTNDWASKTVEEVCEEVRICCQALSERLEKKDFFFGNSLDVPAVKKQIEEADTQMLKRFVYVNLIFIINGIKPVNAINQSKKSIMGPTELDAMVFGHLYILLTTILPGGHFRSVVKNFTNLAEFCKRIESNYYG